MTIVRHAPETQRALVERVLRERGEIATYDALYGMTASDGRPTSITRLAAIVCDLRQDGWQIDTEDAPGALAVYRLHPEPNVVPMTWRCAECNTPTAAEPEPVLGGMARAYCLTCRTRRYFRRTAA